MHVRRALSALLLAPQIAAACDRARPMRDREQSTPPGPPAPESAMPTDVRLACDSAAATATRAGARRVRLVADTEATVGRSCAVIADSLPDATGGGWALFQKGFPGAAWRLNQFEASDPKTAYAVWRPTVFCDVAVRHAVKERIGG